MHSSNFYRNYGSSTSPYKAPSKSANTFESSIGGGGHNRSRSNLHDIASSPYDETWPLDEVINKIDIKSDSEDDFGVYGGGNGTSTAAAHQHYPWRSSSPSYLNSRYNNSSSALNSDRVYSAFPESKPTWSSSRQLRPSSGAGFSSPLYKSSYDTNNNYLNSEDSDTLSDDDFEAASSHLLRDVGIQCNLKKYSSPVKSAAIELPITIAQPTLNASTANLSQKPPIKVIKSSTNGFVSAYSDVPKLQNKPSAFNDSSPYAALDFDQSHDTDYRPTPEPTNDAIYSQVDKSRSSHQQRPPSANSNINIIYKQPLNESISSYRSMADGKVYDVKTKDYGFSVATNPNAPRFNLSNPMTGALSNSGVYMGSGMAPRSSYNANTTGGSYRDLHDIPLTPVPVVEKEIIEETISISNASTEDSNIPPYNRAQPTMDRLTVADASRGGGGNSRGQPYGDNLSFTSKTSSNYRRESPVRPAYGGGSSLSKQSPFSTMETSAKKKPLKKKKGVLGGKNDENVLLANNSLRLKSSRGSDSNSSRVQPSERLYKSNADLRDQWLREETRGGLAAAYSRRQPYSSGGSSALVQPQSSQQQTNRQRALSLNRMNAFEDDGEHNTGSYNSYHHHHQQQQQPPPHHLLPTRYHSQTHLNGAGGGTSSRLSDSSSYHRGHHRNHERDPIVMYIPPSVNHRPGGDQPKLTSILRNNSTKSSTVASGTLPSKKKAAAAAKSESKSQSKTNLKEAAAKEKEKEKEKAAAAAAKKKADLNRRHSMPKDAKLNGASGSWFSKFKLKSNK